MLRVVSVNIEGKKHLDAVTDFLRTEQPDVLCLQEVYEDDLPLFASIVGDYSLFAPMSLRDDGVAEGIAIVSKFPCAMTAKQFAGNESTTIPTYDRSTFLNAVHSQWYQIIMAEMKGDDGTYTIATTHLPVTEHGDVTDYQLVAINSLISTLETVDELVLLGDMNAPRGQHSFKLLAERFKDNVPPEYVSSLDPVLHRAAPIQKMVDGCFSTPAYTIKQTRFQCGISDHCAICVEVTKNL